MSTIALSTWWTVGWAVGAVVILLVAVLILTITALARKVDGVAQELVAMTYQLKNTRDSGGELVDELSHHG